MDLTREAEDIAFDKLRRKLDRMAPEFRDNDDYVALAKLTVRDLRAMLQMYRRHCA